MPAKHVTFIPYPFHAENCHFSNNTWGKVVSGLLRLTVTCDQIVLCRFRSVWCSVQIAMHLNVCFTTSGSMFRHPMELPKVQAQLEEVQVEQFLDGGLQTKLLSPSGEISDNLHPAKGWNQPSMQNSPSNIPIHSMYISFSPLDAICICFSFHSTFLSADLLPR